MGDGIVQVAYLHSDEVSHSWHDSMRRMRDHDLENGQRIAAKPLNIRCGTGQLVPSRNYGVQLFLDKTDHEWLLFVDTDMGFAPDSIDRLLAAADPATRPVMGGLCFALNFRAYDGKGGMRTQIVPTLYRIGKNVATGHESFSFYGDYPADSVVQVAATGAAFLLIHRTALEKLRAEFGAQWFDQVQSPGGLLGEDFSFCLRLGSVGLPVHVHTGVQTTHHKQVWIGEEDYARALGAASDEPLALAQEYVPPATEQTAVIVPVMRRPDNALPFMQSLRATTGLATVYAVCDFDDAETIKAWAEAGAEILQGSAHGADPGTFAQKVNTGYRETVEPWLFITGDDVRFHPGWLDRAQYVAAATGARVVGTNDLGSERVQRGDHATHILIHRDYVDNVGASWDGPGVVAYEGYRHWFVDDEIVTAAKDRGLWAAAVDSIVEHLHPMFGKADQDDVYRLGQAAADTDRKTFAERLAANDPGGRGAPAGV